MTILWVRELLRRIAFLFQRKQFDRDLAEEMQFHVDRLAESRTRGAAVRKFGNQTQLKERSRDAWGWSAVEQFFQDLRHAVRGMKQAPAFTGAALLTLTLGIGVNAAVFGLVHAVLLRDLPYRDSSRLMVGRMSIPDYQDLRESTKVFDDAAIWASNQYRAHIDGEAEQVLGAIVSDRFFPMMGDAALGRTFSTSDARQPVAVISHSLWTTRFGATPSVLGKSLRLNDEVFTIIGVMPPDFQYPSAQFVVWVPLEHAMGAIPAQTQNRAFRIFRVLAHPRSDVNRAQVDAEMRVLSQRLERDYPTTNAQMQIRFFPLADHLLGDFRPALTVLMVTVGLVLLIACANVVNLMLARGVARSREFGIRVALGAGPLRLVRQNLTEGFALAVAGGVCGLLLAAALIRLIPSLPTEDLPRISTVRIDYAVLLFTAAVCGGATLLFGIMPSIRAWRSNITVSLRDGGRGVADSASGKRMRRVLVVAEMVLACIVLIGAGLLLKSFSKLMNVDTGFVADNLVTMNVGLVFHKDPQRRVNAIQRALDNLAAIPGVQYAGGSTGLPPVTPQRSARFAVQGQPLRPSEDSAYLIAASPEFFHTLGTQVLEGREFARADTSTSPKVVIVSEQLARRLFPNDSAIGRNLRLINPDYSADWRTIVGVVRTVRYRGIAEPDQPAIYAPFAQVPMFWMYVLVRHQPNVPNLVQNIRAAITAADPNLSPVAIQPMQTLLWESVAQPRFRTVLLSVFAGLALLLAAIGIYGVIAYSVTQRFQEIGVRLAIGASRADILKLVLGDSTRLTIAALVIGIPAALAGARWIRALLFNVSAEDPIVIAGVAFVLAIAGFAAAYLPARRAAGLDPLKALRCD